MKTEIIREEDTRLYPRGLTLFRIALGLILIIKGIDFYHDSTGLETMMHHRKWEVFDTNAQTISFIITYANLLGGVFIATGLFTRWISMVQIPILIGAVIFNIDNGISFSNIELLVSLFSLILCVVFVVKGSGAISADEFFRSYFLAGGEKGHTRKFFQ